MALQQITQPNNDPVFGRLNMPFPSTSSPECPDVVDGFWMRTNPAAGVDWPSTEAVTVAVDSRYVAPVLNQYPPFFKLNIGTFDAASADRLNPVYNVADALFRRKAEGAHISVLPMQIGAAIAEMLREVSCPIPAPETLKEDLKQAAMSLIKGVKLLGPPVLVVKPPHVEPDLQGALVPDAWAASMAFKAVVLGYQDFKIAAEERLGAVAMQRLAERGLSFDEHSLHATMAWSGRLFGIPLKDSAQIKELSVQTVKPGQVCPQLPIEPEMLVTSADVVHALRLADGMIPPGVRTNVPAVVTDTVLKGLLIERKDDAPTSNHSDTPTYAETFRVTALGRRVLEDLQVKDGAFLSNRFNFRSVGLPEREEAAPETGPAGGLHPLATSMLEGFAACYARLRQLFDQGQPAGEARQWFYNETADHLRGARDAMVQAFAREGDPASADSRKVREASFECLAHLGALRVHLLGAAFYDWQNRNDEKAKTEYTAAIDFAQRYCAADHPLMVDLQERLQKVSESAARVPTGTPDSLLNRPCF